MTAQDLNVLIIGQGGRERAIKSAIEKSPRLRSVRTTPWTTTEDILRMVRANNIHLTVIGPEAALAAGLADELRKHGYAVVGPNKNAAQLETSKGFARDFCEQINRESTYIVFHQPEYQRIYSQADAEAFIHTFGAPIVIKKDGLAGGKGVTLAETIGEALRAVQGVSQNSPVVIEQYLRGIIEYSIFFLVHGYEVTFIGTAHDYKPRDASPKSPMTGGMGAYAPGDKLSPAMIETVTRMAKRLAQEMKDSGREFQGVLYVSTMMVEGPEGVLLYIIEFNCRLGDPEAQVILPLIKSDILELLNASTKPGGLSTFGPVEFYPDRAVAVVLATHDYPAPGGKRVETVVRIARTYEEARIGANFDAEEKNKESGGQLFYRPDIAEEAVEHF